MSRSRSTSQSKQTPRRAAFDQAPGSARVAPPPTVSGRWLLSALGIVIVAAAVCCWGAVCALFWQGSWQLLYHPTARVMRTPANAGLSFENVGFAVTESGQPLLVGWWIPADPDAPFRRFTVLYLHGGDGNLGDAVDPLATLHAAGVNVFAFDPRGYGQSVFAHPSEASLRQDAESALAYLTGARHIAPDSIVLCGQGLGADLALETGAAHPELGGVIVRDPIPDAANAIFNDARARLVPAHFLVRDRYDLNAPVAAMRIPSLWLFSHVQPGGSPTPPQAFQQVTSRKMIVWISDETTEMKQFSDSVTRWLEELPGSQPSR